MKPYKPLQHFLSDDGSPLQRLFYRARSFGQVLCQVKQHLDHDLAEHCCAASIHEHTLVLHTTSSAWATRLRYISRQLLSSLQSEPDFSHLTHIDIKIKHPLHLPTLVNPEDKPTPPTPLSPHTVKLLEDTASHSEDPKLREALRRLARRGKQD